MKFKWKTYTDQYGWSYLIKDQHEWPFNIIFRYYGSEEPLKKIAKQHNQAIKQ